MIRIEHLTKKYGERVILKDLSLQVNEGVIFGLLGPNGAGKTTLVSILNGLSDFQEGEITLFGLPLAKNLTSIRRRCSLIPQKLAFYESLTVLENLRFFAGIQSIRATVLQDRIDYVIDVSRLTSMLGQKAHTLSGGQKRRLNLAIGLLNDPDILFFDEPTVGIDPEARNEILETILCFKQQNKTVIYTSHYMQEIEKICDEVAIINHGEIVAQGSLIEMLKEGGNTNAVIEVHDAALEVFEKLASSFDYLSVVTNNSLLVEEQNSAKMAEILARLELEKIRIHQIRYSGNSLESLFIDLTSQGRVDD